MKSKENSAGDWVVLVMEIESEVAFGVKFPKGVWPYVREFVRSDEIWDNAERKPKFVLRC